MAKRVAVHEEPRVLLVVRIQKTTAEALTALAKKERRSRSNYTEVVLEEVVAMRTHVGKARNPPSSTSVGTVAEHSV